MDVTRLKRFDPWYLASLVLAIMTLFLGIYGFGQVRPPVGVEWNFWDRIHLSLQLFALNSQLEAHGDNSHVALTIAKILAPITAGVAGIRTLVFFFAGQINAKRAMTQSSHVILLGVGKKGLWLSQALPQSDIVGVDCNPVGRNADRFGASDGSGNRYLVESDVRDASLLERLGARRAHRIYSFVGSDVVTIEVLELLDELFARLTVAQGRKTSVPVAYVHVNDPGLIWSGVLENRKPGSPNIRCFCTNDTGARALLMEQPAFTVGASGGLAPLSVTIVGDTDFARSLLHNLGVVWSRVAKANGPEAVQFPDGSNVQAGHVWDQPMAVRLLAPAAKQVAESIESHFGAEYCTVHTADEAVAITSRFAIEPKDIVYESTGLLDSLAPRSAATPQQPASDVLQLQGTGNRAAKSVIYVCLDDLSTSLRLARLIARRYQDDVRIVICTVTALTGAGRLALGIPQIEWFSVFGRRTHIDLVVGGIYEALARQIHDEYQGRSGGNYPKWDELKRDKPEHQALQSDSFAAVDAIIAILHSVGVRVFRKEAVGAVPSPAKVLEDDLLEEVARREHRRWMSQRYAEGWTYGSRREDSTKRHNELIGWDATQAAPTGSLPDEVKDRVRNTVRRAILHLDAAGLTWTT